MARGRVKGESEQKSKALQESEERFRLAFENANCGMALVGPNGDHLRVNNMLCGMLGFSREELEGMTIQDTTHPEDLDEPMILCAGPWKERSVPQPLRSGICISKGTWYGLDPPAHWFGTPKAHRAILSSRCRTSLTANETGRCCEKKPA